MNSAGGHQMSLIRNTATVIEQLGVLIGLPLIDIGRAADCELLSFGKRVSRVARHGRNKGTLVDVGQFSLHVQTFWRLCSSQSVLFGKYDYFFDESGEFVSSGQKPERRMLDIQTHKLKEKLKATPDEFIVTSVNVTPFWELDIKFSNGLTFQVATFGSAAVESGEIWRFIAAEGRNKHLVMTTEGIKRS
jgi:hypothetical protein